MRRAILLSLIVLAVAECALGAPLRVYEVPFPYSTIQEAVNAAADGDTVVVHPGTYVGDGNRDIDFLGKAITVRSEDPEEAGVVAATIIDCEGTAEAPHRAFIFQTFEDANSILDGFTIINGYLRIDGTGADATDSNGTDGEDSMGGAINCTGSSPIIRNCIINNCIAEGGWGGKGADGDPGDPNDPNVPSSSGSGGGNAGSGYGGAIYCDPASGPMIFNCQINYCSTLGGEGGEGGTGGVDESDGAAGGSDANGWGGGVYIASGSTATVLDCIFVNCSATGNGEGMGYGGGVYYGMGYSGALVADMNACMADFGAGIYCDADTVLTVAGCSISGGAGAYGAAIYCATNCVLEISACRFSDGIAEFGAGIYCDVGCNLTISETDISNNAAATDGGGIFFAYYGNLTLNNTSIRNNTATGKGGGMFYDMGGTLTLNGCGVTSNSSGEGVGGGIFAGNLMVDLGAIVSISDCTISNNTALYGAGMCLVGTISTIDDCTISGNMAEYGAGAYCYLSDIDISNCTISDNVASTRIYCSGGGLYCLDSTTRMEDCVLTGNEAQGFGGAVYFIGPNLPGGTQEMSNCLVTGNTAGLDGAGLSFNVDAAVTIANCTVANNNVIDRGGSGGGISCYDASVQIANSILWNNAADNGAEIAIGDPLEPNNPPAFASLSYSDVGGGAERIHVSPGCTLDWGQGNIDADPLFTDGFHLSETDAGDAAQSPCVDAGSDSAQALGFRRYTTRVDIAPDTSIVDMGYHYRLPNILCDCDMDGNVDLLDLAILFSYWLQDNCQSSDDCKGADADLDTDVDSVDYAICAEIYAPVDKTPPTPDPSVWEIEPRTYTQLPGSVVMKAATAQDESGVEYRFVCTGGGGRDSGWQDEPIYTDESLAPGTYTYKFQARDKSPQKNRTGWSEEVSASVE